MLTISDELKEAFLAPSTHKKINIDFDETDFSKVNFFKSYQWNAARAVSFSDRPIQNGYYETSERYAPAPDSYINEFWPYASRCVIEYIAQITEWTSSETPTYVTPAAQVSNATTGGSTRYPSGDRVLFADARSHFVRFRVVINTKNSQYKRIIYPIILTFQDANGDTYASTYRASCKATFKNLCVNLGASADDMPYSDAVQVEYLGYDMADYVDLVPQDITNGNIVVESFNLTENLSTDTTRLKFGTVEGAVCSFDCVGLGEGAAGQYFKPKISITGVTGNVPLGRFRIRSVEREVHATYTKQHVEAYDGVSALDFDCTSWYNRNLTAPCIGYDEHFLDPEIPYSNIVRYSMFSRQMFSVYHQFMRDIGKPLEITRGSIHRHVSSFVNVMSEYGGFKTKITDDLEVWYDVYECNQLSDAARFYTLGALDDVDVFNDLDAQLATFFDTNNRHDLLSKRGTTYKNGGVGLITMNDIELRDIRDELFISAGDVNNQNYTSGPYGNGEIFCVNTYAHGYYLLLPYDFKLTLSDGTTKTKRLFAPGNDYFVDKVCLWTADFNTWDSPNFGMPLVYYDYAKLTVNELQNVTGRDIIRSLIEITGKFFRMNRNGEFDVVGIQETGLYPAEDLYPADDLYPREMTELPSASFRASKHESYRTADFGIIQIQSGMSEHRYNGGNGALNTYVMDDNIFYSNSNMELDGDGNFTVPHVDDMLANMFAAISGVSYVPHSTEAIGMPWMECGDRISVSTNEGSFETIIFSRTLSGLQVLSDLYEAYGEKETVEANFFDWR